MRSDTRVATGKEAGRVRILPNLDGRCSVTETLDEQLEFGDESVHFAYVTS